MHLQNQQPGDTEHQAANRKYINEQTPGAAGIAALVQVVQIGNPASVGALVFHGTVLEIHPQPGIATGTRHGDIGLVLAPLHGKALGADPDLLGQPAVNIGGQVHSCIASSLRALLLGLQEFFQ